MLHKTNIVGRSALSKGMFVAKIALNENITSLITLLFEIFTVTLFDM